jgi:hypothetical protein
MSLQSQDISELFEKAAKEGMVRVFVGLQLPGAAYKPEGTLPSPKAVKQQREAIADAGERLLQTMSGLQMRVNRLYLSIPCLAMTVDANALEHLVNNPLVKTILEDKEREPDKTGAAVEAGEDTVRNTKSGGTD